MTADARRTAACASLALVGFAANSLLCRAALGRGAIDAASFTSVRLIAGAVVLALLTVRGGGRPMAEGDFRGAAALFGYAAAFSFAYLRLGAAAGALILFGVVQLTMVGTAVARGERLRLRAGIGMALACGGLLWLMLPGAAASGAPDPVGAALMAVAGAAWGVYSLLGRRASKPLLATAGNFCRSVAFVPLLLLPLLVRPAGFVATPRGILLAVVSGALASGLGYALWYAALPALGATRAAILQLTVPVLAGVGAVAILGETANPRLLTAGAAVLGGVALAVMRRP